MSKYLTVMSPYPNGVFFVAAGRVGMGGAFPYALLLSLSDLREFLEKTMWLNPSVVGNFINSAETGNTYGCIGWLPEGVFEAIAGC